MASGSGLPPGLLEESGSDWLHIGGTVAKPGWQVLNATAGEHVDHVGDLRDLSRFSDASFDMVYASHVFEHLPYKALPNALAAANRILRPGGRLFISVPDLMTLARMFASPDTPSKLRLQVMRMMFGGQVDAYDFHQVGLWDDYLGWLLKDAGFGKVFRVASFGLFADTSNLTLGDTPISLNLVALR